tara:strand:- start:80 stop:766 length:687 start_codon:yes stop_codon:yes gene_type:complete
MKRDKERFDHLIKNLERTSVKNSIFNYKSGEKAFLLLGQGNIKKWLETLLPNTRLIVEPKIIGSLISIQYIEGNLNKAINKHSLDITNEVKSLSIIPKSLPIKERIEIQGVLYIDKNQSNTHKNTEFLKLDLNPKERKRIKFCAFQIFNCKINHYQVLKQLKNLKFEIPQTHLTKCISDIYIFHECWKQGKLFQNYPTSGIVLKINSRKLQKLLGENNLSIHWAYAIN